jgi:malonyl-CoA O-methyltransferase
MIDKRRPVQVLEPAEAYAYWAENYPPRAHNPLMQAEERAMLSLLPADLSARAVLDAGCGSGRYMLHALQRGAAYVIGVDLSPEMLERARTELKNEALAGPRSPRAPTHPEIGLIRASLEALPLRDRWADVTICGLTLGHLSLEAGLAELQRVTQPGGIIVCSDFHPLAYARGGRREFSVGGRRYAVRHIPHRIEDWQCACAALGLRIVRTEQPHIDPADLRGHTQPDPSALEIPVVVALELRSADTCSPRGPAKRAAQG